jgi:hypothetical protein
MSWLIRVLTSTYLLIVFILIAIGLNLSLSIKNGFKFHPEQMGLEGVLFPYSIVNIVELLLVVFVSVALAVPLNYCLFVRWFKSLRGPFG